jgi:hypothetical protein
MGKVKVTIDKNKEYKAVEKQSTSEIIYLEKPVETIIEKIIEVPSMCQCKCEKAKPDTKLRNYAKALRKENDKTQQLCSILFEKADETEQGFIEAHNQILSLESKLESLSSFSKVQNQDVQRLSKEQDKLTHHLELIDEDLKVKPVSIKTEKVIHTFDHKLVVFNILMLFLNVVFLLQILSK